MRCTMKKKTKRKADMDGAELQALLHALGMTHVDAAKELAVHVNTISRWVTGKTPIAKANALNIRTVLGQKASS